MTNQTAAMAMIIAAFPLSVLVRAWPRLRIKNYGIDAFFYMVYARAIRRQKRLPVRFDTYILDPGEQRYPPGFPLLIALFPERFIVKYNWLVNPVIDSLLGCGLGAFTWTATQNSTAVALALVAQILTPTLVHECSSMNSRIFGNVLFTVVMLIFFPVLLRPEPLWVAALCLAGPALLMTHKMSTQNFLFVTIGLCLCLRSPWPMVPAAAIFASTLILTLGFYVKVLAGNIGILLFWRRNLQYLYVNMVYRSPVYNKNPEVQRLAAQDDAFFKPGIKGFVKNVVRMLDHDFLLPLFLYVCWTSFAQWGRFEQQLAAWALLTYLFAAATTFIPPVRFLGEGIKYIKMAAFPMHYLLAAHVVAGAPPVVAAAFALCLGLNILKLFKIYKAVTTASPQDVGDLEPVFEHLRGAHGDGVLTMPYGLSESVAWHTDKKVLWGAHGGGFDTLDDFFPVLRRKLAKYFPKYKLDFLIVDTGYVDTRFLNLDAYFEPLVESGRFALYRFTGVKKSPPAPQT